MIHKFFLNGYYIVLDVFSGGVHVVDKLTYDMLDSISPSDLKNKNIEKFSENNEIKSAFLELCQLYDDEVLFSEDDYIDIDKYSVPGPIKSMCLNVAHDCNLRCKYCFASTGDFGEGRKLLDLDTGKKAIDFLIDRSKGRKNLEIDFFGGEPLMNFQVVMELVKYARSKEMEFGKVFRFTTTTNGILLNDEYIDFINREMSNIVLSVDGRKEINDQMRVCVNGSGSYDLFMPKFKKLVDQRDKDKDYYVRGTYTKNNLDFSNDVFSLYDYGFDQISVEPVVSDPLEPYSITADDLPRIFEEYDKLSMQMIKAKEIGNKFNFFHFMIDLEQGPCVIKRIRGCGCGNEYIAITPDGDIYPCHQFVGIKEWKMGNINDGTFNEDMRKIFAKTSVYNKEKCKSCWARFYCSGGCNANNVQYMGDILKPLEITCEIEKKRVECAIMMKVNDLCRE